MTSSATDAIPAHDIYAKARFNMVESQIRTNRVTDPALLAALSWLPRQIFVPDSLAGVAYVDKSLRIVGNRYLLEPLALARLVQEATITSADKVLVIGAGTGYSTALIAGLAASVTAVESDAELAETARVNLAALGIANAIVETGPLDQGAAGSGPYDVILIDGMIGELPTVIADQIAPHGRLVTIRSQEGRCGAGMLYRKLGGFVSGRVLFDATGPFLPGLAPRYAFVL
ncbi:MAG: pcm [Rhodospirillales bacterium]|nr:pcm [Rhodospirillales bacterium]